MATLSKNIFSKIVIVKISNLMKGKGKFELGRSLFIIEIIDMCGERIYTG